MQRWFDWIEDLLARGGILRPDNIHRANRVGLYVRRAWFTAPSEMRQILRSAVEFLIRMVFGVHILVIGGIAGPIALIEKLVPAFNVSTSTWWKLLWLGLSAAALWTFHKIRKERDRARKNFGDKSETLKLARELDEMIPESPWGEIHRLKKCVGRTTGAPTVEQVRDVKRRWMSFIKAVRNKLVDTSHKTEFGYEDDSNEWARIRDLDTSDVRGSLNKLESECQFFSRRLDDVTTNMRHSAAAITTNSSSD